MAKKAIEKVFKVNGEEMTVHRIDNSINGAPRYVVHFLDLGIEPKDYGKIPGLVKYRGKWFGGGYVFSSYHVPENLEWMMQQAKDYYSKKK